MKSSDGGHAPRVLAHRLQQQQRQVASLLPRFVSDGVAAGCEQGFRLFLGGPEVEAGEQHVLPAQQCDLGPLRFLHLHNEFRSCGNCFCVHCALRSSGFIRRVGIARPLAGSALHDHSVAEFDEFRDGGGHHADAVFLGPDPTRDTDVRDPATFGRVIGDSTAKLPRAGPENLYPPRPPVDRRGGFGP
jgi:hypothetical protein